LELTRVNTPTDPPPTLRPPIADEHLAYARWLDRGAKAGFVLLVAGFLAYATGLLPPAIPFDRLPELLALPLDRYLAATGAPTGWGWARLSARGDYASLVGIAILAGCSVPCLFAALCVYLRRSDIAYAMIVVAQIAVLLLAASGVLTSGY
jgi:hypothetical protein